MARSGSKDFSVTRSEIIAAALRKCGVYDHGEAVPAAEEADAAFALNVLVKEWSARGIDIWLRKEFTLFLQELQTEYQFGVDHATTDYVAGYLSSAAPAGTTVNVEFSGEYSGTATAIPTLTVGDFIGVKTDGGYLHWTTINSFGAIAASVGANTYQSNYEVFLDSTMLASAAEGNAVYAYTTKITRPLRIIYAMRRDSNNIDVPVGIIGENEYQALSLKQQKGPTTQLWYKPTLDTGALYVWPTSGGSNDFDRLIMQAHFYPDDFDAVSNEPQFPIEWANALIFHLAHDLAAEYGVDRTTRADLFAIAQRKLTEQLENDVENANVVFTLDERSRVAR